MTLVEQIRARINHNKAGPLTVRVVEPPPGMADHENSRVVLGCTYGTMTSTMISLTLAHLSPEAARNLATELMRAADKAESRGTCTCDGHDHGGGKGGCYFGGCLGVPACTCKWIDCPGS